MVLDVVARVAVPGDGGYRSVPGFVNHPFFGLPDILVVESLDDNCPG